MGNPDNYCMNENCNTFNVYWKICDEHMIKFVQFCHEKMKKGLELNEDSIQAWWEEFTEGED